MVDRRLDDVAAHEVAEPVEPLTFTMPALPAATLVRAEQVFVAGRLPAPVSVEVVSGGRLVVTGPNGVGKSTLSMGQQRRDLTTWPSLVLG